MIPVLAYPLALAALATLPALAAIYILRNRFRRRQVSSLLLWRFRLQSREGGVKVHRLRFPLLFFLELLVLILLVTAAAGPHWQRSQSTRPLIVVLDDSFSMRAAQEGRSAQHRAWEYLENLFHRRPPPSARFILAGSQPRLLGSARTWMEASDFLRQWQCWAPAHSIEAAIILAADLGKQQANILVLTDGQPAEEKLANDRLQWMAFGTPLQNMAIVTASRTTFGDQDRCLIEVANLSGVQLTTTLRVHAAPSNALSQSAFSLAPRERQRVSFSVSSATPLLRAFLDADALAEDNQVELLPPIRRRVRVRLALSDTNLAQLAQRALAATGLRAALSDQPELIIHQGEGSSGGTNAWSLRWISPAQSTAFTGPFIIDSSHPLAAGMALQGVVWAGAALTNAPGEIPIILAGNTPLLSVRESFAGRELLLNLNPDLSTLSATADWPILFSNLLQWRAAEMPGLTESNVRLGTEVALKTTGEGVKVKLPDSSLKSFPKTVGDLSLETPMPGIYEVVSGSGTNFFAVNPLAPDESDLASCGSGTWGAWSEDKNQSLQEASMVWMFGLAALGLLATHLYLLATGKGGR